MKPNAEHRAGVPGLEAAGVAAGYGSGLVLQDVSLAVAEGDCVGLIGPNGAGKTTLLRVLSGALPVASGEVRVMGRPVRAYTRRERSRVAAFVPQSLPVPVAFSVAELAAMGRTPYVSGWSRLSAADRAAVERAMEQTDVRHLADRSVGELSAGEMQRAIVAMALAQEPRILLLDEPTAHLDIHHAWGLMEIVRGLNRSQGLTVVMSAHDLNLAAEFCTRLVLLERGRVVAAGAAGTVLEEQVLSRVYRHPLVVLRPGPGDRRLVVPAAGEGA
ncbi:MAG: ABC transporter ATP-binding protein [Kiritimatiellae bacterium]|nr:ABC transporter ATP-binding protein [Kiritimatiellia bacterium]